MPVQSIDLSGVTDATFDGSAVEQINLNGSEIWAGSSGVAIFYNNGGTQTILPDNIVVYSISNGYMQSLAPTWQNQAKAANAFGFMNHNGKLTLVFTSSIAYALPSSSTSINEITDINKGALPAQYPIVEQDPIGSAIYPALINSGGGYYGFPLGLAGQYKAVIVATLGDDGNFTNLDQTFASTVGGCSYSSTTAISVVGRVQISNNTITTWGGYKNEFLSFCGVDAWNHFSLPSQTINTGSVTWDANSLSFSNSSNITFGGYSTNYGTPTWSSKRSYHTMSGNSTGATQTGLNSTLEGTDPETGAVVVNIGAV